MAAVKRKRSEGETCEEALKNAESNHFQGDLDDKYGTIPQGEETGCVFKCEGSSRFEDCEGNKKHGRYGCNGYNYIKNDTEKRDVYEVVKDPSAIMGEERVTGAGEGNWPAMLGKIKDAGATSAQKLHMTPSPANWKFDAGPNYRAAYLPYNHQYHHMLPWEALKDVFSTKDGELSQLMLIQKSGYNLNEGINLIILPREMGPAQALKLPRHFHGHPAYSAKLALMLNEVRALLVSDPKKEPHTLTDENDGPKKLRGTMEAWEKKQFKEILDLGKTVNVQGEPRDVDECPLNDMEVDGTKVSEDRVHYETRYAKLVGHKPK